MARKMTGEGSLPVPTKGETRERGTDWKLLGTGKRRRYAVKIFINDKEVRAMKASKPDLRILLGLLVEAAYDVSHCIH